MTTRSKVSGLPPRLSRNQRMHAKKTSIESCRWPPRSARFSVRKKCVVCFRQNLTKSKFSLFRLSNNLCCHWCWSLCSRTYPNPSKNTKSDPKSLTRIALHRISCGSACLTQVRPSPFWGAPRTVVKPRASSPPFFYWRYTTPPCSTYSILESLEVAGKSPAKQWTCFFFKVNNKPFPSHCRHFEPVDWAWPGSRQHDYHG